MPSDFLFRLSNFIMLTIACLSLGYAEWDLLPEVTVVGVIVVGLLLVPFWKREQFELSLWAANRVGLCLGVVIVAWMTYQFLNRESLIYTLPWPASLLPYLGPILMALIAAKMFRPKHVGDWWAFQGIGLASIALACALANDEGFGILLLLYAIAAIWSLLLFTYRRDGGHLPAIPNRPLVTVPEVVFGVSKSAPTPGVMPTVCWLALAVIVALPFFFLTPRSNTPRWSLGAKEVETGYNSAEMIDLNTTGTLTASNDVAFRVAVHNADGSIKSDLPADQYWRGMSYHTYTNGQWKRSDAETRLNLAQRAGRTRVDVDFSDEMRQPTYIPPELGPDQYTLDFERVTASGEPIIAAPPAWVVGQEVPIATINRGRAQSWWQTQDGTFRSAGWNNDRLEHYRQVQVDPAEPGLGSAMSLRVDPDPRSVALRQPFASFVQVSLPNVQAWAIKRLETLADTGKLDPSILRRARKGLEFQVEDYDYEAVGRALCESLKNSPEYVYSVELTREVRKSDPIEDFLLRTKSGHCQRFASALALALRSVGVPTRYTLGFRGYDVDDDGTLLIRQDYAHAWVEVLIPRPHPTTVPIREGDDRPLAEQAVDWHWLILDATPDADPLEQPQGSWLTSLRNRGVQLYNDFIVDYNDKKHKEVSTAFWGKLLRTRTLVSLSLIVLALFALALIVRFGRRFRVRSRRAVHQSTGLAWYDDYLALLNQYGFSPAAGATPREYAASVTQQLEPLGLPNETTRIPREVTEQFHHARYAERPLTSDNKAMIQSQLTILRQALKSSDNRLSIPLGAT